MGLLREVVAGPRRTAHGRYRYEAMDPVNGLRKGTCHVLFAEGEIALLDPDSDFSLVEPVDAISGISIERSRLAKKSTLQFDLNGMAIKLTDTVSSDQIGQQITTSLARMFPGAMPLRDVKWCIPQASIARDEFKKKLERIEYAARGEISPRDIKKETGGQTVNHQGPIHYWRNSMEFDGWAVTTEERCSFGFVRDSGEVVPRDRFDFKNVSLIAWRKDGDSILVEVEDEKPELRVATERRLLRFLDGPDGMFDYIIEQISQHSRFNLEGRMGEEESVQGLKLLPEQGT